jgi:glycosyltransferase involved in cell wall biosynthesis
MAGLSEHLAATGAAQFGLRPTKAFGCEPGLLVSGEVELGTRRQLHHAFQTHVARPGQLLLPGLFIINLNGHPPTGFGRVHQFDCKIKSRLTTYTLMKIAIAGTRGIPARYGGFETFAEELARRLVERGHQVTVYCRQEHSTAQYLGVDLVTLPTLRHKYFDTVVHTGITTLHLLGHRHDVVLYCNAANAIFTWMPRLAGMPVALNVDGLERNRKKWNKLGQAWYQMSEWLSTWCPNAVVTDAAEIERYYRDRYSKTSTMIPYGADCAAEMATNQIAALGLERGRYFLYVSRMEPENNGLLVRQAFERVATDMKLALIGDAPYAADYIRRVRDTKDPRIVMPGAIYGEGYRQLGSHCFAYVHATEVGGTHPALIEAMGRGALTLYLETPENAEVAGGAGLAFTHDSLATVMTRVLAMDEAERNGYRAEARRRVQERYSWEAVTTSYEELFKKLQS